MASSRVARTIIASLTLTALLAGCGSATTGGVWAAGTASTAPSSAAPSDGNSPGPSDSPSATASPSGTAKSTPPATTAPKPPVQPGNSPAANAVLAQINAWRSAAGLRPYTMLPGLVASAHKHNLVMIAGCGLKHQCPGEPAFGDRIKAQGVHWSTAGENIGDSGKYPNTTAAITESAKGLNTAMFNEKPPNDGHRRNLLSKSFTHIGIDVIRDSHGTVWLTEDFTD
jgi:uncharacterized protein YkwD